MYLQDFTLLTHNDHKLITDDNVSEMSYELQPNTELPMHLIISDTDLHTRELVPSQWHFCVSV